MYGKRSFKCLHKATSAVYLSAGPWSKWNKTEQMEQSRALLQGAEILAAVPSGYSHFKQFSQFSASFYARLADC